MRFLAAFFVAVAMVSPSVARADIPTSAPPAAECESKKAGDPCASVKSGTCQKVDASASLVCAAPPAVQAEKSSGGCSTAPGTANTWFVGGVGAFCVAALLRRRPSRRRNLSFA